MLLNQQMTSMDRPTENADAGDALAEGTTPPQWRAVSAAGDNLRYEDFLSFRLGRLTTLIQRECSARYLEPCGLSLPEWRVLARLATRSSLEMRELTRVSLMDKAAISRTIDTLIDKGYAERHTDPTHAKRRIVAITPAGRRVMRKVMPMAHREQAALLRLLSSEERELLGHVVTKLTVALLKGASDSTD
jgi:DNA-binding MarR family transcriptional regulator